MRLTEEWKRSISAAFVTLTYDQYFVPKDGVEKEHVQLFMKRLRKNYGERKIRYFAVGEYGTKTGRPHYHLLLFSGGEIEESVDRSWRDRDGRAYGITHIGKVSTASIQYCTKYVIQRGGELENQNLPFRLMSRAYGIGGHYLTDDMVRWHRENEANYTWMYGEKRRLPRYYKEKIWPKIRNHWYADFVNHIREELSEKWKKEGELQEKKIMAIFIKKFGLQADLKREEFRNALLSRVKEKVAFTQTM